MFHHGPEHMAVILRWLGNYFLCAHHHLGITAMMIIGTTLYVSWDWFEDHTTIWLSCHSGVFC